jgi:hypothetical protein
VKDVFSAMVVAMMDDPCEIEVKTAEQQSLFDRVKAISKIIGEHSTV